MAAVYQVVSGIVNHKNAGSLGFPRFQVAMGFGRPG
jgi:hypothetical protein